MAFFALLAYVVFTLPYQSGLQGMIFGLPLATTNKVAGYKDACEGVHVKDPIAGKNNTGEHVILDLGANDGQSFNIIMQQFGKAKVRPSQIKAFLWEMNPKFPKSIEGFIRRHPGVDATLYKAAASNRDGNVTAFIDVRALEYSKSGAAYDSVGSSLFDRTHEQMKGKAWADLQKKGKSWIEEKKVCVMDFTRWAHGNLRPDHNVFMKIDIEGAEFEVLQQLIDSKAAKLIDTIGIEWHGMKMRKEICLDWPTWFDLALEKFAKRFGYVYKARCRRELQIEQGLRDLGVRVTDWLLPFL